MGDKGSNEGGKLAKVNTSHYTFMTTLRTPWLPGRLSSEGISVRLPKCGYTNLSQRSSGTYLRPVSARKRQAKN